MKRIVVETTRETTASPEAVFALLKNSSTYPTWSPIQRYEMERPGAAELHGVGEIRVLITGPLKPREEITEIIANRYMAYRLLGGLPMRDYIGETTLEPLPNGGVRVTWRSSFYEQIFATGFFWRLVMMWVQRTLLACVFRAALQRAAPSNGAQVSRSGSLAK